MRAELPPEPRVVGRPPPRAPAARHRREVLEVPHRARHSRAWPASHRHLAGGGEPVSRPWRNGELAPSACSAGRWAAPVEGADRGLGVGHPDVDVQAADRRRHGIAERLPDALIARPVGDLRVPLDRRGCVPPPIRPAAGLRGRRAAARRADRPASPTRRADVGDQLNLAGVQLALDPPAGGAHALEHGRRGVDLGAGHRVDEEQLLLDAEREVFASAKGVVRDGWLRPVICPGGDPS